MKMPTALFVEQKKGSRPFRFTTTGSKIREWISIKKCSCYDRLLAINCQDPQSSKVANFFIEILANVFSGTKTGQGRLVKGGSSSRQLLGGKD